MAAMTAASGQLSPQARMLDLIVGYWISCGVHVAVRLSLADEVARGPRTADELAATCGAHGPSLFRLLRMLASSGVFRQRQDGRFENTALSETLRKDVPGSMRAFAGMMVDGYSLDAWEELLSSVKTGTPAFHRVHGQGPFEFFAAHPEKAREFGEAMSNLSSAESPAIAAALDLTGVGTLLDVGGSHGTLLAAILARHPGVKGIVCDRPEVVETARRGAHARDPALAGRLDFVAGDFFQSLPAGADACIMKYILHDWDDARCVTILKNCRAAMQPDGRVLVCDCVIPAGNDPHWGKLLDVNMLALTGGRERTEQEFATLLSSAGFRLSRVIPTGCPLSIVEGVAT